MTVQMSLCVCVKTLKCVHTKYLVPTSVYKLLGSKKEQIIKAVFPYKQTKAYKQKIKITNFWKKKIEFSLPSIWNFVLHLPRHDFMFHTKTDISQTNARR